MLVVWALEQHASPSLLANRLGALIHSLRSSRSRPLLSCFCTHHEVNHRVTQSISDFALHSQHLTCLSHFSAPDVRVLVRRVIELIKMTDVARCSEHH